MSRRSQLIRLASSLEEGSPERRGLLRMISAKENSDKVQVLNDKGRKVWVNKSTLQGPNASKYKPLDGDGKKEEGDKKVDPKLKELIDEYKGDIPDYKLEIIAGEAGDITEKDLRRAKAVKAQLERGIKAAADVCQMSPPVCEGNFGVARSSMPQIMDVPVKDLLASMGEGEYSDLEKKVKADGISKAIPDKKKRDAYVNRRKGLAAVAAGADPDDDRTIFQQTLDAIEKDGTKISSQKPPYDKRRVGELKATQKEIKAGKTYGIANAYLEGKYDPREAPIIISKDNHILDGHHRYSAMITADPDAKMNVIVVDMPMKKFLEKSFEQPGVFRADLQDNIVDNDKPLDLARDNGSTWKQGDKFYAKNMEGEAGGPYKDEEAAKAHAKGTRFAPERGTPVKKSDKKEASNKKKPDRHMHVIHKAGDRYVITMGDPRKPGSKILSQSPYRSDIIEFLEDRRISNDHVLDLTRDFGIPNTYSDFYMKMTRQSSNKEANMNPADRTSLIRLASTLEKGTPLRRAILAGCEKLPAGPMRDNCEKKSKAKKDDDKKEKKAGKGKVPDALKKHQFKPGEGAGEDADGDGKANEKKPDFLKKKASLIRLAASLPKGSKERRALLALIK